MDSFIHLLSRKNANWHDWESIKSLWVSWNSKLVEYKWTFFNSKCCNGWIKLICTWSACHCQCLYMYDKAEPSLQITKLTAFCKLCCSWKERGVTGIPYSPLGMLEHYDPLFCGLSKKYVCIFWLWLSYGSPSEHFW